MSTDRELLELAAKAAGIDVDRWEKIGESHGAWIRTPPLWSGGKCGGRLWSPLDDDGDALRLAVAQGLSIEIDKCEDESRVAECECEALIKNFHHLDGGADAATRRAIVRTAAEIGRAM